MARRSWSKTDMESAVYAVENDILTTYAAARLYKIPRRTLRDYVIKSKGNKANSQEVTEAILEKYETEIKNHLKCIKERKQKIEKSVTTIGIIWYCHACRTDSIADMRQCYKCFRWYHEVCVGLTIDDVDRFECPTGC